jgi:beta-glucosidase
MAKNETITLSAATHKLIDGLLAQLTLEEKCALLSGKDGWATVPVPRLKIASAVVTDGPHGVRPDGANAGRKMGPATYFPTGVSMAATWNPDLIREMAKALGEETRDYGCDVLLGPCVNIVRSPLAGRNFESLSEDPFLAGRIAAAWIAGIQSQGVGASLKHFACNNQETERFRGSSVVDERTMRELYLSQFEYAVKASQPWTVMCAYNRINGVYASQNDFLLNQILRKEWGFAGLVVSDWGAVHSGFEAVAAGLDLEMPGPAKYFKCLPEMVGNWQIPEATVDQAARRILELLAKTGRLGRDGRIIKGSANTPAHQQLARKVAAEAITLLKNDGNLLPLQPQRLKSLAIIGRNAAMTPQGGGSSAVPSPYRVSPLEAVTALLGRQVDVKFHEGCAISDQTSLVDIQWLQTPGGGAPGLYAEYFAGTELAGKPLGTRVETSSDVWWTGEPATAPAQGLSPAAFSGRWTTELTAPATGQFRFGIDIQGSGRLFVDEKCIFVTHPFTKGGNWGTGSGDLRLVKGRKYTFRIEFVKAPADQSMHVKFFYKNLSAKENLATPAQMAAACDAAIVFAGYPEGYECEGADRTDMRLTGQNHLIAAVRQANPRTIVVLNTGTPVEMPWAEQVPAILQAYYPGQEGGNAIADILFGRVNPSGKLSVSYPVRHQDTPAYLNFPGDREVRYDEGVFVGYRYYDTKGVAPLFPFGHGLSYTTFAYSHLRLPKTAVAGADVKVALTVKNVGPVAGQEVVQLYVSDPEATVARPEQELKGFAKVELKPGESRELEFILDARAFAFYDVVGHDWKVEPGAFVIRLGASSRDLRLQGTLVLAPAG